MRRILLKYTALAFVVCLGFTASAQIFKFRVFADNDGINRNFVYTINQDVNGYLWVGTGEGLFRYDGFRFTGFYEEDGLADNFVLCSYQDRDKNLWYGHEQGKVTYYDGKTFKSIDLAAYTTSRINDLTQDPDGRVWVVTQNDGLICIEKDGKVVPHKENLEEYMLYSLKVDETGSFLVGTDMGLLRGKMNTHNQFQYEEIGSFEFSRVSCISSCGNGEYLVGTDDAGVFKIVSGNGFSIENIESPELDLSRVMVNEINEDSDGNIWISSNRSGLYKLIYNEDGSYNRMVEFSEGGHLQKSINTSFLDRERNLWIGTSGQGLVKLEDDYFSFFGYEDYGVDEVHSIYKLDDQFLLGTDNGLAVTGETPEDIVRFYGPSDGLPDSPLQTIARDDNGTIWVGSENEGLYYLLQDEELFKKFPLHDDQLSKRIKQILVTGKVVSVATDFGIYQIKDLSVRSHLTMHSGIPHNIVNSLYKDSRDRIWLGTLSNEVAFIDEIILNLKSPLIETLVDVKCFVEDKKGNVWAGTDGSGLFMVSEQDTIIFNKSNGLFSDYCYSLACDEGNNIWVGHHGGLSRIDIETRKVEVYNPASDDKLDFLPNAVLHDNHGVLWFGTNQGLLRYNLEKDISNGVEPALNLVSLNVSDSLFALAETIDLPYGTYKIRFDFVGISLQDPDEVSYKYILEGHDLGWSELDNKNYAIYPRLDAGEYTFRVTSYNNDGVGGELERSMKLTIDKPFWGKWWFFLIIASVAVLAIRWYINRRERIMRANQEYLQKELDERTREVVEQKELLEVKNKDITDSILYAKNIQKAMLPPPDSLEKLFPESFVFYKPRDIVSGDFYWVDRQEDTIFLACADCTGHGVPGAFMSVIGNVLLKEVAHFSLTHSPAYALTTLDKELKAMLNKENSEFGVQDGMDISFMEYNTVTHQFRAASARRPIIIYKDGERHELKGDRISVGGVDKDFDKEFTLYEMELSDGDAIYQFSDGIADQFGGELGKKLKKTRLLQLLDEYKHLNMVQQGRLIRQKFFEWKGSLPQVDDVILVGVRI